MAYERTIWKNREVERPRTFTKVDNGDGTITLVPAEGNIIEQGTPIIAANMNNIEDGIEEALAIKEEVTTHLADLASQEVGKGASKIGIHDANNNFAATNVEGALKELFINVSNGKSLVGGAITGVDPNVVIPTDPTFQQLATAIGQISTGKKFASGDAIIPTNNIISTNELSFQPRIVVVVGSDAEYYYRHIYANFGGSSAIFGSRAIRVSKANFALSIGLSATFTINSNGFQLDSLLNNVTYSWIAYE